MYSNEVWLIGSQEDFLKALDQVPDVEPAEYDRLPEGYQPKPALTRRRNIIISFFDTARTVGQEETKPRDQRPKHKTQSA